MLASHVRQERRRDSEGMMSLSTDDYTTPSMDPMELVESCLTIAGWNFQRDEEVDTLQCIANSRWGEMGSMFAARREPPALHFSITLDVKPTQSRRAQIAELIMMANERLWLGHCLAAAGPCRA